jgi:hypothetical protein
MCCHADEFCYHDLRKAAVRAEAESSPPAICFLSNGQLVPTLSGVAGLVPERAQPLVFPLHWGVAFFPLWKDYAFVLRVAATCAPLTLGAY